MTECNLLFTFVINILELIKSLVLFFYQPFLTTGIILLSPGVLLAAARGERRRGRVLRVHLSTFQKTSTLALPPHLLLVIPRSSMSNHPAVNVFND